MWKKLYFSYSAIAGLAVLVNRPIAELSFVLADSWGTFSSLLACLTASAIAIFPLLVAFNVVYQMEDDGGRLLVVSPWQAYFAGAALAWAHPLCQWVQSFLYLALGVEL